MKRWLKIAVPLGLAAVLVAVLAIGFGPPSSHAVKPSAGPTGGDAVCADPDGQMQNGRVKGGASEMTQFEFCSDPDLMLTVRLTWNNNKKDLGLSVTSPDGVTTYLDRHDRSSESFNQYGPLPPGTWTIMVDNHGTGGTPYDLEIVFR